jgi:Flp pilus assembly protein TadG
MIKRLFRLARDKRGAAVVELAMVAPLIATMVVGVVDLSNAFGRKLKLEQASQRAIEKIMNTTANATVEETLKAEAATQAEVAVSNVTVTYRIECDGNVTSSEDCADGETMSKWISVEVVDKYKPLFPVHLAGINADGTYHIKSTAGMRIQ